MLMFGELDMTYIQNRSQVVYALKISVGKRQ